MKTTIALLLSGLTLTATAQDWPMWGGTPDRNMVGEMVKSTSEPTTNLPATKNKKATAAS